MATVFDVAAYILKRCGGSISTMKLQKLVYYSQAWSLVWDEGPLFKEPIQAWANGPVVYELFKSHQGSYSIDSHSLGTGDPANLSRDQVETVDAVFEAYGHLTGLQLSELAHREQPWLQAREGLGSYDRSTNEISTDVMQEYYTARYEREREPVHAECDVPF